MSTTGRQRRYKLDSLALAHVLIDAILDKKGQDILLLDMRDQMIFADYFLLCNGESDRQLKALARALQDEAWEKAEIKPWVYEGEAEHGWVLVDFNGLAVHCFLPDQRVYYDLEGLWSDARVVLRMQ